MSATIAHAGSDEEILSCFPVMAELRPHLSCDGFVELVRHLGATTGFRLAYAATSYERKVNSVAGYQIAEWLAGADTWKLRTSSPGAPSARMVAAANFLEWLMRLATQERWEHLRLVSNVRRSGPCAGPFTAGRGGPRC